MQRANGVIQVRHIPKLYQPLWTEQRRYKGFRGGRGGGKSHAVAERLVLEANEDHVRAACMREVQNSIKDSVKQLLEDKINEHGLESRFKITEREIVGPHDSLFIFRGLQNHTAASIKSLEGFNRAWYEESQTLSARSLELATPTFRSGSSQIFTWNQDSDDDPVETFFNENAESYWLPTAEGDPNKLIRNPREGDPDFVLVDISYWDNPFFPAELRSDMERDRRRDPDKHNHVWCGGYRRNSEARVFRNVRSFHFTTPSEAMFMHGADFGFSIDPTTLVRCFTGNLVNGEAVYDPEGRTLFIDYEVYQVGCEIEDTPKLFDSLVPGEPMKARKWEIRADSARPETISHCQKHGYPMMVSATKGPNSVVEGIAFLQDYDIVVHPRCRHAWDELNFYSYKIDKKTNKVTRELEDKKNHVIDAIRYAIEELRKATFKWYVSGA